MTIPPSPALHPPRRWKVSVGTTPSVVLLASSSVAYCAGLLIPTWSVQYTEPGVVLAGVIGLLAVALAGVIMSATILKVLWRGLVSALADVVVAAAVFSLTWFSTGPSLAVSLWLLISALLVLPAHAPGRRTTVIAGLLAALLSVAASFELLTYVQAPAVPAGVALNAMGVLLLGASALKLGLARKR